MSPTTGAGGKKSFSETEGPEGISDIDRNDELDNDLKLEENDEEEPITIVIESQRLLEFRSVKFVLKHSSQ